MKKVIVFLFLFVFISLGACQVKESPKPPFKVLYGNDATNITSCPSPFNPGPGPFKGEYIVATVDESAVAGVDAHLFQPGVGWVPWWQSEVYPMEDHKKWLEELGYGDISSWDKYVLKGGDIIKVFVDRCRQKNIAPIISIRLNDVHHIYVATARAADNPELREKILKSVCRFYGENPQYRIGDFENNNDRMQYTQDWSHKEVRDYRFNLIKEICENYDIAGIELDFMRHAFYFNPKETNSDQRKKIMVDFVKRVRNVLDATSKKGQYRWLSVRIPGYMDAFDKIGVDVEEFAKAGVNIFNLSSHYFTNFQIEIEPIRQMLPENVGLYSETHFVTAVGPQIQMPHDHPHSPGKSWWSMRRTTDQQYYTLAHLTYSRGGQGISTFNYQYYRGSVGVYVEDGEKPLPFHIFEHLGDPNWLAQQPQHYCLGYQWEHPRPNDEPKPFREETKAGQPESYYIDMAPPEGGWKKQGKMRIQARHSLGDTVWKAKINDVILLPTEDVSEPYPNPYPTTLGQSDQYRAWIVPSEILKDGKNKITLLKGKGEDSQLFYLDIAIE